MKPQVLTMLALRVVAIYAASQAFTYLAQAAMFLAFPPANWPTVPVTFLAAVWLLSPLFVAAIIWWCAPYIACLAARGVVDDPAATVNTRALVGATFVAAGALIFITALPGLVGNTMRAFEPPQRFVLPMLVASILRCVLGIALVIGSGTASKLLLRLRYAGTPAPDL